MPVGKKSILRAQNAGKKDAEAVFLTEAEKKALAAKCARAGRKDALVRIACHELESFYLGDLEAVKTAYGIPVPSQKNRKFRTPDNLANAAEELKKITKMKYQKVEGSRLIARHLKLDGSSSSASFNALLSGILRLIY